MAADTKEISTRGFESWSLRVEGELSDLGLSVSGAVYCVDVSKGFACIIAIYSVHIYGYFVVSQFLSLSSVFLPFYV